MAGFSIVMILFSIMTKFTNGTCLLNVKYMNKLAAVCALSITAFAFIALASYHAPDRFEADPPKFWFVVAVLASSFVGIAQGLGEATFLGFLKGYPSHTVGYVSCGTGFAGLFCIGLQLFLRWFDVKD